MKPDREKAVATRRRNVRYREWMRRGWVRPEASKSAPVTAAEVARMPFAIAVVLKSIGSTLSDPECGTVPESSALSTAPEGGSATFAKDDLRPYIEAHQRMIHRLVHCLEGEA
jgi:hypothetical protein